MVMKKEGNRMTGDKFIQEILDIVKNEDGRPPLDEFINENDPEFTEAAINRDKSELERFKSRWREELESVGESTRERLELNKKRSSAFEATICFLGEESNWFGEEINLNTTTEYDDVINGEDLVGTYDNGSDGQQHFAIALDATADTDPMVISKKITRHIEKIVGINRWGQRVKYFKDQEGNNKPLDGIIPFVIGLDKFNADEIMSLFLQIKKMRSAKKKSESEKTALKDRLKNAAEHPAQAVFCEQMRHQIELYKKIINNLPENWLKKIEKHGLTEKREITKNTLLRDIGVMEEIISGIERQKKSVLKKPRLPDGVLDAIKHTCTNFNIESIVR